MINKLTPRAFVADKDERLVTGNEMVEARNVLVTQEGEGSELIIKSLKSTNPQPHDSTVGSSPLTASGKVIGQVEDRENGRVYFFFSADSGNDKDAIYMFDENTAKYKAVFQGGYLNFSSDSFVSASLITKDFQQNGTRQTIIYFTDNVNPPRKINVDRALDNEFSGEMADLILDGFFSVIKHPSTVPPSFQFSTDDSYTDNNFYNEFFQFATQIIYKDGEESALSPFSKIAVSLASMFAGVDGPGFGTSRFTQNVCNIRPNVDELMQYNLDLEKIRILARPSNSGAFFVVDEFNPFEAVRRNIGGSEAVELYSPDTGVYKFYNNASGRVIDDITAQKLYDNVPLKASAVEIADNRLLFADYEEGRPQHTIPSNAGIDITPVYNPVGGGILDFIDSDDAAAMFSYTSGGVNFSVDISAATGITGYDGGSPTKFPAGTQVEISTIFNPEGTITAAEGNLISFAGRERGDFVGNAQTGEYQYTDVTLTSIDLDISDIEDDSKRLSVTAVLPEDMESDDLALFIQQTLDEHEFRLRYNLSGEVFTVTGYTEPENEFVQLEGEITIVWKFGEDDSVAGDTVSFKPRVHKIISGWEGGSRLNPHALSVVDGTDDEDHPIRLSTSEGTTAQGVEIQDIDGDAQDEVNFSDFTGDPGSEPKVVLKANGSGLSFKAGATHSFGIVYYDKYGRSSFVHEIGDVYVKNLNERSGESEAGAVQMKFDLSSTNFDAPNWAESYQIVYSGSSIANTFQYTVGGAYPKRLKKDHSSDGNKYAIDKTNRHLYISLKTLDQFREEKNAAKNYSFTRGDKLRILSRQNSTDAAPVYPETQSTNTPYDDITAEFDVLGVEVLDEYPVRPDNTNSGYPKETIDGEQVASKDNNPYKGTFVVISSPLVEAQTAAGASAVQVDGHDWYMVTGEDYNSSLTLNDTKNYWNRECLVEIITPKESTSERLYYEIGERRPIIPSGRIDGIGQHGRIFTVSSGDVWFRPSMCKTPVYAISWKDLNLEGYDGDFSKEEEPITWEYTIKYIEDPNVNDMVSSANWDKGRSHAVFNNAATLRRQNSITYSERYADDVTLLPLSSFVASNANFYDLPSEYGRCRYIRRFNDRLLAIQSNKASLLGLNKNVLETGSGDGFVSLSRQFINNILPYAGDYGTQNPESVLVRDGVCYFVDVQRRSIVRLSSSELNVVSDKDVSTFVDDKINDWESGGGTKVVCGYWPENEIFFITFVTGTSDGFTLGYDDKYDVWQGEFSFNPDAYSSLRRNFYLYKYYDESANPNAQNPRKLIIHRMGDGVQRNRFLGEDFVSSKVTVIANEDPSMVKMFKSISIEGNESWATTLESSLGQTTAALTFSEKEDAFYADVTGDTSSNSTGQYFPIGTVSSIDSPTNTVTFSNNLRGVPVPAGYEAYKSQGSTYAQISSEPTVSSVNRSDSKVVFSNVTGFAVGDKIFVAATHNNKGDQIRGHYCKIKCEMTNDTTYTGGAELYAINANYVNSKANHA